MGVRSEEGPRATEFELEDREHGVESLLEVSSLLFRLPREVEYACHDRRRRFRSSLSLPLEYFLLCNGRRGSGERL